MNRSAAVVGVLAILVCVVNGQQGAEELEKKGAELRKRLGEIEQALYRVSQTLGLVPGREKGAPPQDEEMAKLYEQAETARKAAEAKAIDILKADEEGAKVLARIDEIKAAIANLEKERRDAEKSLEAVSERLGLRGGRRKKGEGAPNENPEITALRQGAQAAQKAYEDKKMERLKADPEAAKLIEELDQIKKEMQELRERSAAGKWKPR